MKKLIFVVLFLLGSVAFGQITPDSAISVQDSIIAKGAAVTYHGKPIFQLHADMGAISKEDRALLLEKRIALLENAGKELKSEDFSILPSDFGAILDHKGTPLLTLAEKDAIGSGKAPETLAQEYRDIIISEVNGEILLKKPKVLMVKAGLFAAALLGLIILIILIRKFFIWIRTKVQKMSKNLIFQDNKTLKFFNYITPRRERDILDLIFKSLNILSLLILFSIYIPFLFSILPWTRTWAEWIFEHLKKPLFYVWDAIWGFLPNLFFIVIIALVSRTVIRLLGYVAREIEKDKIKLTGFYGDWAMPTFKMIRFLIIAFTLVVVFPYLPGSDSPAFQGISIFLGVLFSLGSTSAISNIVAGVVITYMRPFQVGDRVKIGETVGDVMERTLLVTRIKTIKNVDITIPNSSILGNHLMNFSRNAKELGLILHTTVTIGYDVPSKTVIEALIKGAKATEMIEAEPAPFVLQTSLDDFYISYEINATTREASKMALVYSRLHESIKNALHDAGIEILSPHYSAVRDGNVLTVPPENIPPDYKKPGFFIENPIDKLLK